MKKLSLKYYPIMAILLFSILILSACKPTPAVEPVVGKQEIIQNENTQNGEIDSTIEQESNTENNSQGGTDSFIKIEVPARVESDREDFKNISITQNADVIAPDATAYPITEVSKKIIDDNLALEVVSELAGTDKAYSAWTETKGDILQSITQVKQSGNVSDAITDYISFLEQQYETAPVSVENPTLNPDDYESGETYTGYLLTSSGDIASFSKSKEDNMFSYARDYQQVVVPMGVVEKDDWEYPSSTPKLSKETAYDQAMEWLEKLGVDLKLQNTEVCSVCENAMQLRTGWMFTFMREISGLQSNFTNFGIAVNKSAMPSTGSPWQQEFFQIAVDEQGICSIWWQGASQINKTIVNSIKLEDFDMIQTRVKNQLQYNYATDNAADMQLDFTISKYELGISMLSVKNDPDLGQYTPTWYVTFGYPSSDGTDTYVGQIMFNAVDGSYVEPRITTNDLMSYVE